MQSHQQLVGAPPFGRLTVLECAGKDKGRNVIWRCQCACGRVVVVRGCGLLDGTTRSCGCLQRETATKQAELMGKANATHGLSRTPTWVSWSMMMQRCTNPKRKDFKDWGGRGIKPCRFVAESPTNVIALIGERPNDLQIDRINNDSGYTCGQCEECKQHGWPLNIRWSDRLTQMRNTRNTVRLTYQGVTLTRREHAERLGKTIGWVRHNIG